MKTIYFCLIFSLIIILTLRSKNVNSFLVNKGKRITDEFNMLADLAKNINEQSDEGNFLKRLNIFLIMYNMLKQNHLDQGQKKLVYHLLNKLGKKLLDHVPSRDYLLQNNKALHTIFENLEVIENERTKANQIPFKWGR